MHPQAVFTVWRLYQQAETFWGGLLHNLICVKLGKMFDLGT